MSIILASASPRRKELLEMLGVKDLIICPAKSAEAHFDFGDAADIVASLANAKADEVAALFSGGDTVIAADTVVELDGAILGKPLDEDDAARMLRQLSGRVNRVFTGLAVRRFGRGITATECTAVRFRRLSESEIDAYVRSGEPLDKAGAYGAQGLASLFVEGIEGDFFNVMGLPLYRLGLMLSEMDVKLL